MKSRIFCNGALLLAAIIGTGAAKPAHASDLALTAQAAPATVTAGQSTTFTINVANHTLGTLAVNVTATLPFSFAVGSISSSQGTTSHAGNDVSAQLGSLPAGAAASLKFVATPKSAGSFTTTVSAEGKAGTKDICVSTVVPTQVTAAADSCTKAITSDFNGTPIKAGNFVWFSSVVKVKGATKLPVRLTISNATLKMVGTGGTFVIGIPDGALTLVATNTPAISGYVPDQVKWYSSAPASLGGNYFIAGATIPITAAMAKGIKSVTWSGDFTSDQPSINVNWLWGAAVYTKFSANYNELGVKTVDDDKATAYKNSDHAGTPEKFKPYVVGGARGGGGSNFTGSYSGTLGFSPCECGCTTGGGPSS